MEAQRMQEIKDEAKRRVDLWLENMSFAKMTVSGSFVRFNMCVGAVGYPFQPEARMNPDDFKRIITDEECDSPEYDEIMRELFRGYYGMKKKKKKVK